MYKLVMNDIIGVLEERIRKGMTWQERLGASCG